MLVETHSWKQYPTRVRSHAQRDRRPARSGRPRNGAGWLDAARSRGRARRRARRHQRAARLRGHRRTSARRLPRLRLHARAVGDLRRASMTRYDERSRRSGTCRCATRCSPTAIVERAARRLHRARRATRRWVAEKLRAARHRVPAARRAAAGVSPSRRSAPTQVTLAPSTFEGAPALTLAGAWNGRGARRPGGLAVRADRAAAARAC